MKSIVCEAQLSTVSEGSDLGLGIFHTPAVEDNVTVDDFATVLAENPSFTSVETGVVVVPNDGEEDEAVTGLIINLSTEAAQRETIREEILAALASSAISFSQQAAHPE